MSENPRTAAAKTLDGIIACFCNTMSGTDDNLLRAHLHESGFSRRQVVNILATIQLLCNRCWNQPAITCTCSRQQSLRRNP